MTEPLLEVRNLSVRYPHPRRRPLGAHHRLGQRRRRRLALDRARRDDGARRASRGSGKTSLGLAVLRGVEPSGGTITLRVGGTRIEVTALDKRALRRARRHMQMIFQDPYASLNPRMTVRDILSEPLLAGAARGLYPDRRSVAAKVLEIAAACGLSREQLGRLPHAFSGGQRQRIAIARALVLNPELVVCDEPISSLDVSIQAQILNLLAELQERLGLTYLFIAHDLAAVAYVCDRVAVMYLGRIVEIGPTRAVYFTPRHPYTEALMSAVPGARPRRAAAPDPARRRAPGSGEPAVRLPLPHPLPPRHRHLRGGRAPARGPRRAASSRPATMPRPSRSRAPPTSEASAPARSAVS